MHAQLTQAFQKVAGITHDCEAICIQTIQYCLELGGSHADPSHVQLLQDCADICETTARGALRGSPQTGEVASACANICELCAAACQKFADDPQMKACANQCLLCASACWQVGPSTTGAGTFGSQAAGYHGQGRGGQSK